MLWAKGAAGGGDPLGEPIPVDGGRDIQLGPADSANLPAKGREQDTLVSSARREARSWMAIKMAIARHAEIRL
jgi:hypothetical protein